MEKNFFEELEKNDNNISKETYDNNLNGTERNINYFLKLSQFVKIIMFTLSGLLLIIGLIANNNTGNSETVTICIISSILLIVGAILSTPFLEWKAYMLKNIYEINKSTYKNK